MEGVILFQSKYGATKKYADWIAAETGFPCVEIKKARIENIRKYDIIILGGGIYASGIAGLSFLKKHYSVLSEKRVVVFCVGASPFEESAFREIVERNLTGELENLPCFYCRGSFDMNAMNVIDRNLCKMLKKAVSKKDPSEYQIWEKAFMEAGSDQGDWTDKKYIEPILKAVK